MSVSEEAVALWWVSSRGLGLKEAFLYLCSHPSSGGPRGDSEVSALWLREMNAGSPGKTWREEGIQMK